MLESIGKGLKRYLKGLKRYLKVGFKDGIEGSSRSIRGGGFDEE